MTPLVLYMGTGLLAVFMAVDNPTRQALVPNLVPRIHLTNALALNSTQRQFGQIAGPSIAGLVLAGFGPGQCYLVEALSRIATIVSLLVIAWRAEPTLGRRGVTFGAVREGLGFVRTHPIILSMMVLDLWRRPTRGGVQEHRFDARITLGRGGHSGGFAVSGLWPCNAAKLLPPRL